MHLWSTGGGIDDGWRLSWKYNFNDDAQFENYMNNAHCSYVSGWISKNKVFEELPPKTKKKKKKFLLINKKRKGN